MTPVMIGPSTLTNWRRKLFQKGRKYRCISSKSNAYTVGSEYECFVHSDGKLSLRGNDGFIDPVSNLLSKFAEVKDAARKN